MLVDSSNSAAGSAVAGAIQQASQATGTSFNYLLATAKVESGLNPHGRRGDLVRARAVPVHPADLACHHETGRPGTRLRPICRCHHPECHRAIRGRAIRRCAARFSAAQRSDRERGDGRGLHQGERVGVERAARPRRPARASSTSRIFSAPAARRGCSRWPRPTRTPRRRIFSPAPRTPIPRFSTIALPAPHAASRRSEIPHRALRRRARQSGSEQLSAVTSAASAASAVAASASRYRGHRQCLCRSDSSPKPEDTADLPRPFWRRQPRSAARARRQRAVEHARRHQPRAATTTPKAGTNLLLDLFKDPWHGQGITEARSLPQRRKFMVNVC